jgi:hypothetical protein
MLLPQYPHKITELLDNLQTDTGADSALLFHLDGALCAAQGKYTNEASMRMITGFNWASVTNNKHWTVPGLAFKQGAQGGLFYAAVGEHHILTLVFSHGVPTALVKLLLRQFMASAEVKC